MSLRITLSRKFQVLCCLVLLLTAFAAPVTLADDETAPAGGAVQAVLDWIADMMGGDTNTTDDDDEFMGSIVPGG